MHQVVKIAIVAGPLALTVALSVFSGCGRSAKLVPKSIEVLPFENLSRNQKNAELADGIRGEIVAQLAAKIADWKIFTSRQPYKGKPRDLRQIAKQVGVANIVEGSVVKADDQVRLVLNCSTHKPIACCGPRPLIAIRLKFPAASPLTKAK